MSHMREDSGGTIASDWFVESEWKFLHLELSCYPANNNAWPLLLPGITPSITSWRQEQALNGSKWNSLLETCQEDAWIWVPLRLSDSRHVCTTSARQCFDVEVAHGCVAGRECYNRGVAGICSCSQVDTSLRRKKYLPWQIPLPMLYRTHSQQDRLWLWWHSQIGRHEGQHQLRIPKVQEATMCKHGHSEWCWKWQIEWNWQCESGRKPAQSRGEGKLPHYWSFRGCITVWSSRYYRFYPSIT